MTKSTNGPLFVAILSALMAFTSLSTDIYLPAMPVMAVELQGDVELTVTGFLIGFALAQLVWGPISDHLGRRLPLFIGMVLFVIGSLGCAHSTSINEIVFWRVFQAMGACTGPMLARAMIRDLFSRTRAAQMLSTLIIVMAVIGVLMFLSLWFLPETLPAEKRTPASLRGAFRNYGSLLKNHLFMRYTLSLTFFYVAAYAFITGSPRVYISFYGIDPQYYGWLFAVNIVGVMGMSMVNRRLVQRYPLETLLKAAVTVAAVAVVVLAVTVKLHVGGIAAVVACVFVYFSMNGIIAATSTAAALDEVPNIAGSASALIGSLQYGSGIVSSLLLALFSDGTPWTMAWIMALFTLASAAIIVLPRRP